MSYFRRTRTNLLNNDRFADNKRFDSHFSGARKERDRGDVRGIDRHSAAEAPRDLGSSGLGRYRRDRSEIEPSGWPGREGDDPAAGQSLKVKGITAMFCSLTHGKATADANISSLTISDSKGSGLISARVCPPGLHPDAGRRGHQRERKHSPALEAFNLESKQHEQKSRGLVGL